MAILVDLTSFCGGIIESISNSVSETAPLVLKVIDEHPEFKDIGKRMLLAWQEGVTGLRDHRIYAAGDWSAARMSEGISDPTRLGDKKVAIGRSPLLGSRNKATGEKDLMSGIQCRTSTEKGTARLSHRSGVSGFKSA